MSNRLLRLEKTQNPQLDPHWSSGGTAVEFDSSVVSELADILSVSPDGATLTANVAARVRITAGVVWADEGGLAAVHQWRTVNIVHNGATQGSVVDSVPDDEPTRQQASATLLLQPGDTVQAVVNNGRSAGATVSPSAATFLEAVLVPASPTGINPLVPAVLAYKTQDQMVESGALRTLEWQATEYDPLGMMSNATDFVVPDGVTHARATMQVMYESSGDETNLRLAGAQVNGSYRPGISWRVINMGTGGIDFPVPYVSGIVPVVPGDVITAHTRQYDTTASKNIRAGADGNTFVQVELAPAA